MKKPSCPNCIIKPGKPKNPMEARRMKKERLKKLKTTLDISKF